MGSRAMIKTRLETDPGVSLSSLFDPFHILTISTRALWNTLWLSMVSPCSPSVLGGYSVMRAYVPAPLRLDR